MEPDLQVLTSFNLTFGHTISYTTIPYLVHSTSLTMGQVRASITRLCKQGLVTRVTIMPWNSQISRTFYQDQKRTQVYQLTDAGLKLVRQVAGK